MEKGFYIGQRQVGIDQPPYFIADIGANHDGSIERALRLIELAKEAGADAAKFQNFTASKIVSRFGFENLEGKLSHQSGWKKSVYEVYEDASISEDWTPILKKKCDEVGIEYFTSPYDFAAVDHIDPYVNLYKIGSGDITWSEIIKHIAGKGKPVLIATGAADMADVERAMDLLIEAKASICLMQCNTNYTLDADKYKYVNLNVFTTFKNKYPDILLGLSDHTVGAATTVGAVALGARIIEKHFTDDNEREGPDHKFAMNPRSWRTMVDLSNEVFHSLGDGIKRVEPNETQSRVVQQRALRAKSSLEEGTVLLAEHFEALRPCPADALRPYELETLIGKKLLKELSKGEHITLNHF
ncbi:N-acetylneuraminate synthase [Filimonas zeae]|uniref:N-acetylneuraminate synthase n=1 Tax=Filimonas zeae TaxID=1737353 RepID=A0A917MYS3_9BACT|nr:N-acetylneuraminate synthase family protein [Filimonas zeae]MDR6341817.1 N-acetylneuraminate synthase [Filimonas zeae]GGH80215.1 N-acetylneuraminate synthase [Filimonas zeae]